MTLVPRLPNRRRAARLLAALFVPFVVGAAFAGLVVCSGPDGVRTSWEASTDGPRRGLSDGLPAVHVIEGESVASECLIVPGSDEAVVSTRDVLPDGPSSGVLLVSVAVGRPVPAPVADGTWQRGPPAEDAHLARSVVLRV